MLPTGTRGQRRRAQARARPTRDAARSGAEPGPVARLSVTASRGSLTPARGARRAGRRARAWAIRGRPRGTARGVLRPLSGPWRPARDSHPPAPIGGPAPRSGALGPPGARAPSVAPSVGPGPVRRPVAPCAVLGPGSGATHHTRPGTRHRRPGGAPVVGGRVARLSAAVGAYRRPWAA
jgi:hypothetical protein